VVNAVAFADKLVKTTRHKAFGELINPPASQEDGLGSRVLSGCDMAYYHIDVNL